MAIDNLEERLAAMQPAFTEASADTGSPFEPPPDGDYQALVKRFDFFESKAGQAFLKTEMEVVHDQAYNGREVSVVHNLEDPERINYLKRHLDILGADVKGLDLRLIRPGSELLGSLCDTPVEITVKTSDRVDKDGKPYRNIYVNRRLGEPIRSDVPAPAPAAVSTATVIDDEKIPFTYSWA